MDARKKEIRTTACQLAVRESAPDAESESRTITGTAIVFNSESELLDAGGQRFREVILPEAVTQEWLDSQDVKMNMLHDRNLTIARSNKGKGSMNLTVTERGVDFEFDAPKCDIGDRCLEMVRRGDYSGCSFEFYADPDKMDVDNIPGSREVKVTHRGFSRVTAVTIGMDPAYTQTSVNAREMWDDTDEGKAEKEREIQERDAIMKAERARRLGIMQRNAEFDDNF